MGLKDNLDASVYANPDYNYETMRQIRLSLYSGIDLLPYLNRGFADDDLLEHLKAFPERGRKTGGAQCSRLVPVQNAAGSDGQKAEPRYSKAEYDSAEAGRAAQPGE